jgi:hypothetical protein
MHNMLSPRTYAAALLIWNLQLGYTAQEPRLSYNLEPGMHCTLAIEIQQNTMSESLSSDEISLFSFIHLDFQVDSVESSGSIHMTAAYSDLVLSMLAPGLALDVNSENGKNPLLTGLLEMLQKGCFRVIMNSSGALQELSGLDSLFMELSAYPASDSNELHVILGTLEEAYGPNAFQGLFNLFVSYFPVVQPISNWTRDITYFFNSKPVNVVNRYYLTRATDELVIIQGMGMLNSINEIREKLPMGEVKSTVSGSQTYDFQVDPATGWLKKCVSRQRVMIETTVVKSPHFPEGLKIPSYTETVFEVKGTLE